MADGVDIARILDRIDERFDRLDEKLSGVSGDVVGVATRVASVERDMTRIQEILTEGVSGEKSLIERVGRLEDGQGRARQSARKIKAQLEQVVEGVEELRREHAETSGAKTPARTELAEVEIARAHSSREKAKAIALIAGVATGVGGTIVQVLRAIFGGAE